MNKPIDKKGETELTQQLLILFMGLGDAVDSGRTDATEAGLDRRPHLFPHGITSIKASLTVADVGSVSLEMQGPDRNASLPQTASSFAFSSPLPPAPAITAVTPDKVRPGEAFTLVIQGSDFTDPRAVDFHLPMMSAGRPTSATSTRLEFPVKVFEDPTLGFVKLIVYFKDGSTATLENAIEITRR